MTGLINLTRNGALALTCAATAILISVVVAARWQKRSRQKSIPSTWRRVGVVSQMFIYPLKSGQAVELEEAECTELGLKTTNEHSLQLRDRFFLAFTEETGKMKTARQHPNMVLIKVTYADESRVTFEAPDMPMLTIKLPAKTDNNSKKRSCKLWSEEVVEALDCGDEAAEWMSKYLLKKNSGIRLGFHAVDAVIRRDFSQLPHSEYRKYYKNLEAHDSGAYSDLASYMLMTEESVQELKDRVAPSVPGLSPLWFRPNFVVRGSEPFAEDKWDFVRIGDDVILGNVKPCTRCIMTTIDPETGIKEKNMEPLRTLKSYRQLNDSYAKKTGSDAPALGINLGLRSGGNRIVEVGDPVFVASL